MVETLSIDSNQIMKDCMIMSTNTQTAFAERNIPKGIETLFEYSVLIKVELNV